MSENVPRLKLPVGERDHVKGPANAKVILLEYGDYQCPYCGEAYGIIKKVQEKFPDDLRFVFRNFPLTEVHQYAGIAAEVAESAGAHGKFWEMHDFIYEHQPYISNLAFFLEYAEKNLGLNAKLMKEEISSHVYVQKIREDFMSGVRSGVNGTPTFFINDLRHNGDYHFETLVTAIKGALKPQSQKTAEVSVTKGKATRKKVRAKK